MERHHSTVISLSYSHKLWQANLFALHHSAVDDYSAALASATGRRLAAQTQLDVSLTRSIAARAELTLGANNLLDDSPPFSEVRADFGFDPSQADLVGRTVYLKIRVPL